MLRGNPLTLMSISSLCIMNVMNITAKNALKIEGLIGLSVFYLAVSRTAGSLVIVGDNFPFLFRKIYTSYNAIYF
jgi:hypothetical protein